MSGAKSGAKPGAGPVVLNGALVYACWAGDGPSRLRVSADEWDRLGVGRGERLRLTLPKAEPLDVLVLSDTWVDPCWVWLSLGPVPTGPLPPRRPARARLYTGGRTTSSS